MHRNSRSILFLRHLSRIIRRQDVSMSADASLSAVCTELGKPLEIKEVRTDTTAPQPHEVIISVKACGVNFADILLCKGLYQEKAPLPFIPGTELSGQITAVGDKVQGFQTGERVGVLLSRPGSYRQTCHAVVSGDNIRDYVWKMPESMSYETASILCVSYGTAMMALTKARLREGETILVTGAAGSTGLAAVEIAANVFKSKVIGACGSSSKGDVVLQRGASHVMEYSTIRQDVKRITEGRGVDVVFDTVGGDSFLNCLKSLAHEGRILTIGYTSSKIPSIPANLLLVKSCTAMGIYWGDYRKKKPEDFFKSIEDCILHVENGNIKPFVGEQLPLSQVNQAFEQILKRKTKGKIVLKPQE